MVKWNIELIKEYILRNSKVTLISKVYDKARSKLEFKCECGNLFKTSWDTFIRKNVRQCNICGFKNSAKKQKLSHQEFEELVKEKLGEDYRIIGEYKNSHAYIEIYHEKCDKIWTTTRSRILKGHKCGNCCISKKLSNEDFLNKLKDIHGDTYIPLEEYVNSETQIKFIHKKCGKEFKRTPYSLFKNNHEWCPYCKQSQGCTDIENWLIFNNIKFIKEYKFSECKHIRPLPFDFYLPDFNICIEFDGEQHIKNNNFFGKRSNLEITQKRDKIKDDFCFNEGIVLIRIPYRDKSNISKILNNLILYDNTVLTS